ncbi:MAG: hypothetical protein HQL69_09800 [Magnetococcales bacterium]|nr:hypothetical protein [Magnetococcales bacterium]
MKSKLIISSVISVLISLSSIPAIASEMVSDKELIEKCQQLVLMQQVHIEEREEFVLQCALDLKERYQPNENDEQDKPSDHLKKLINGIL